MRTTYQSDIIVQEIEKLIAQSCGESIKTGRYETMHRAIIKKHFNAVDVAVLYEEQKIEMKIKMNEKDFVSIGFKCPNLESFLTSCIEKDNESLRFYESMLTYFNLTTKVA